MASGNEVDVVARVLGGLGVLLALASLVWQVISWRLSGSVVKVRASAAILGTLPTTTEAAVVAAVNKGRAPVSVTGWGFELPNKMQLVCRTRSRAQPRCLIGWTAEPRRSGSSNGRRY